MKIFALDYKQNFGIKMIKVGVHDRKITIPRKCWGKLIEANNRKVQQKFILKRFV